MRCLKQNVSQSRKHKTNTYWIRAQCNHILYFDLFETRQQHVIIQAHIFTKKVYLNDISRRQVTAHVLDVPFRLIKQYLIFILLIFSIYFHISNSTLIFFTSILVLFVHRRSLDFFLFTTLVNGGPMTRRQKARRRFKNSYELLNLRVLKNLTVHSTRIFRCIGKIFCVEFQRYPLKFHTKYLTHTLKDMYFIRRLHLRAFIFKNL